MKWDLRERSEDAIAAYLRTQVPGDMKVYEAWGETTKLKYPCAVVMCGPGRPVSDDAEWNIQRMLECAVVVVTQRGIRNMLTHREQHAHYFSEVYDALSVADLTTQVIASGIADIAFSGVILEDDEAPVVEDQGKRRRTSIGLTIYAEPVEGS